MDATSATHKSWLTLSDTELEAVVATGQLPEGFDWNDLAEHPQFEALFKFRDNPAKLAQRILELHGKPKIKKQTAYVPVLSMEYRQERLRLKQAELEVQRNRAKISSVLLDKVRQLETKTTDIQTIVHKLLRKHEALEEILTELRVRARLDRRTTGSHRQ